MPSSFIFVAASPAVAAGNGLARGLNAGASNDTAEEIFRKHFNPSSSIDTYDPSWDALIKGISAGDQINFDNGAAAVDQLWIHSASGIFLDRRAADVGVVRPDSVGISDDVFRRLTIKTTTKKLVTQALLEAMEVYYGSDSTRANLTCTDGPYALVAGWELLLSIDDGDPITIPFAAADFANVNAATAREVAAVITRWLERNDSTAYALAYVNPLTGLSAVRIYSSALGLKSSVQAVGGQAQNVLLFPTLLTQSVVADVWAVAISGPGVVRFTMSGATTTDLNLVQEGDYVNVYSSNFNEANRGTHSVAAVDVRYVGGVLTQYFEIDLNTGVAQAAVVMLGGNDLVFFRPRRTTINDNGSRAVIVSQTHPGEVGVQLPATTIAVSRTAKTGAYANTNTAVGIASLVRSIASTTVITDTNHGLAVNGQVFLDGVITDGLVSTVTAGNGTTTTDISTNSILTKNVATPGGTKAAFVKAILLSNGDVFGCGGYEYAAAAPVAPVVSSHRLRITNPVVQPNGSTQYTYAWVATANMPVATHTHALALLSGFGQDGNVLSTGGSNDVGVFSTSYIFNVGTNAWSVNIPMTSARFHHTATTLTDGRVLVCGGYTNFAFNITNTSELMRVVAAAPGGSWAAGVNMVLDRAEHTAIRLDNGKVLIIGGSSSLGPTSTCELFDPTTNAFTSTGSMGYSRGSAPKAVALPNNRVFVWGGYGQLSTSAAAAAWLTSAEIYDGATGRWSPAMSNPLRAGTSNEDIAYLASENQIVVFGRGLNRVDLYDVATGRWKSSPAIGTEGINYGALVALSDYPIVVMMGGNKTTGGGAGNSVLGANLYISAKDQVGGGGINGQMHKVVSVVNATTFTINTPDHASFLSDLTSAGESTEVAQVAADATVPGPYIYDPDDGFTITGTSTLTTSALYSGTRYQRISVTAGGATAFPDEEGWLVFGFGTEQQTAPVKYVGREDADTLILDFKTTFPIDLAVGTTITLLDGKGPFVPTDPLDAGSLYITDSSSGRVSASKTLDDITAGGIDLVRTVVYPGDIGLGAEGFGVSGQKLSDKVGVWAGNEIDAEMLAGRGSV